MKLKNKIKGKKDRKSKSKNSWIKV